MWFRVAMAVLAVGLTVRAWTWWTRAAAPPAMAAVVEMVEAGRTTKPHPDEARLVDWVERTVRLDRAVETEEVDAIAEHLVATLPASYAISLRFVLADWPRRGIDPEVGQPFYAWRLIVDGRREASGFSGLSQRQAAAQIAQFAPAPGERLIGVWVDPYSVLGAVALVEEDGEMRYVRLVEPAARWVLGPEEQRGALRYRRAVHKRDADGSVWRADGTETDSLAVSIAADGRLHEHAGRYRPAALPWLVAHPWRGGE